MTDHIIYILLTDLDKYIKDKANLDNNKENGNIDDIEMIVIMILSNPNCKV